MALKVAPGVAPTAREIRSLRREFARRHTSPGNRAGSILLGLLVFYVCGGTLWWAATRPATVLADSALLDRQETATWAWALLAACLAAGFSTARALGPVATSLPDIVWLLPTPIDRAAMLRRHALAALLAGGVAGLIIGRFAAFVAMTYHWGPMTVLGGITGVATVSCALLAQNRSLPPRAGKPLQWVLTGTAATLAGTAAAHFEVPTLTNWPTVIVAALLTTASAALAVRSCGRISCAELAPGMDTTAGARASLIALDVSILAGILDRRTWRRIGTATTRRLPGNRFHAMIRSDLLRYRRRPSVFVLAAVAVGMGWFIAGIGAPVVAALAQLGSLFAVALLFSSSLRELCADADLRVLLGLPDHVLRPPFFVVPIGAVLVAAVFVAALSNSGPTVLMISVAGSLFAAYRLRTRPSTSYDGLILETGYGQLPIDLIRQLLRGPDVLIATTIALLAVA